MDLSPKQIKQEAGLRIATTAGNHKRLILIYSAIALGASLLNLFIDFFVDLMVMNTGGLGDLGTRAILQSVSQFTNVILQILSPLWYIGMIRTMLRLSRQEEVAPKDLTQGFSRWGVYLRLMILQGLIYFAILFIVGQVSSIVFTMTPLSLPATRLLADFKDEAALMEALTADRAFAIDLLKAMLPLLILWLVVAVALVIYVGYGMRLSLYRILDDDRPRARRSLRESKQMMKGNRMALFCLDLSYWWFYLLQVLLAALVLVPLFLQDILPVSYDVMQLIAAVLQAAGYLWLYHSFLLHKEVSYAVFYDTLYEEFKNPPVEAPQFYWQQQQ